MANTYTCPSDLLAKCTHSTGNYREWQQSVEPL